MEFEGRCALVTGAAQGVGRAVAELLAARGATVIAVDVSAAVTELDGARIEPRVVDLADAGARAALVAELAARQTVDLLVNNAATYPPGGLLSSTDADWLHVLQVNLLAAASLARAVAARLVAEGRPGAIVNVGSVQQSLPLPGYSAYVVSKGGLTALTAALAVELGHYRIRVNEVSLGLISSATLTEKLGDGVWADSLPPTLLGRTGRVEEAAEAIAFLGSDRSGYVTGAVLAVDGGRRLSRLPDAQLDLRPAGRDGGSLC